MEYYTSSVFNENFKIGDWVLGQYKDTILPVSEIPFWRDVCKILISEQ